MTRGSITWGGIGLRFLAAFILVFLTYNPFEFSYFHWTVRELPEWSVYKVLAGLALLIGWVVYLRATTTSLGGLGLVLAAAFFGCLAWLVIGWGWVDPGSARAIGTIILVITACVLGVGISWSHIRRRLTGQYDVDDIED